MKPVRKRKILKVLGVLLLSLIGALLFFSLTGTVAYAAGLVDNTVSDANAYSKYPLENYQLDFYVDSSWDWLPWNWLYSRAIKFAKSRCIAREYSYL